MEQKPTLQEINFLNYAYNFFLDVHEEINNDSFWNKDPYYRFNRIRDAFLVYSEVLEYEPVGWFLDAVKRLRPPLEAELYKDYLLFIRNILIHFPFFKSWDEITFTKNLINWSKPGRSIDKFLSKTVGTPVIKYRVWDNDKKGMTYVSINFPAQYTENTEIRLKDFMPEKEGIIFAMSLMHRLLMTQVESLETEPEEHQGVNSFSS